MAKIFIFDGAILQSSAYIHYDVVVDDDDDDNCQSALTSRTDHLEAWFQGHSTTSVVGGKGGRVEGRGRTHFHQEQVQASKMSTVRIGVSLIARSGGDFSRRHRATCSGLCPMQRWCIAFLGLSRLSTCFAG